MKKDIDGANKYWIKHIFSNAAKGNIADLANIHNPDGVLNKLRRFNYRTIADSCSTIYNLILNRSWDTDAFNWHIKCLVNSLIGECERSEDAHRYNLLIMSTSEYAKGKTNGSYKGYPWDSGYCFWDVYIGPEDRCEEFICESLAWMCKQCKIYWDDSNRTSYELDFFKKSVFGKKLWEYECFVSQVANNVAAKQTTTSSAQPSSKQRASKSGKGSYQSRGALSAQARDLISAPGDKFYVSNKVYILRDRNAGGNKVTRAFIRPTNTKGEINGTNKVFVGNNNNFGDCTCTFANLWDAEVFVDKINGTGSYPNKLAIESKNCDSNGYFNIGTEFGPCLIRAFDLNEELFEEISEEEVDQKELAMQIAEELYTAIN